MAKKIKSFFKRSVDAMIESRMKSAENYINMYNRKGY